MSLRVYIKSKCKHCRKETAHSVIGGSLECQRCRRLNEKPSSKGRGR